MREQDRRRKANIILLVMMLLGLVAVSAPGAEAIGVGPSRKIISFAAGQEISDELMAINNDRKAVRLGIYAQGEFSDSVTFERTLYDIGEGQVLTAIPYRLKMPASAKPGEHKLELVVREFPPGTDIEGSTVTAAIAVISEIIIKVPYPGKYAEGKMFVSNAENMDKDTQFTIMVYNYGSEDIDQLSATVDIYSPTGDKVGSAETNRRSAKSKEEIRLAAMWPKEVKMGSYIAKVTVKYDDKEFFIEQPFDIGRFTIELSDVKVDNFRLGDVAKFDVSLMNNWNKQIDGVFIEFIIDDNNGNEMNRFKTAAIDIPAGELGKLEGYWYTADVMPGIYQVKMQVNYAKKITQKIMTIEVDTNKITFLGEGTGMAISQAEQKEISTQGLLIMLIIVVVILLIMMNVVWFYFLTKRFKEKSEK
ncbi:TPA: hypothetical protein HA265_05340 [Candidatus Woesearchaeota archaeon]|nr:hypothetical protein [Candidatus Woesearchaeota archaeon]